MKQIEILFKNGVSIYTLAESPSVIHDAMIQEGQYITDDLILTNLSEIIAIENIEEDNVVT